MATAADVHKAVTRLDDSMSISDDAAEFMTRAAPYQFNRMIEGLIRDAKRMSVTCIDIEFLKEIELWEE
ncbi:MAG: hypothetical protein CL799_09915 [Chromatiales bacterium]|nr:hypothetical protein [Chromatiales bacterium]